MAARDVKQYYYKMRNQYLEMKADLADFEQAVREGNITEEQLADARKQVEVLETNYNRLMYVMYLLEMPTRTAKHARYNAQNKKVLSALHDRQADTASVELENKSALDTLRAELKKLTKSK